MGDGVGDRRLVPALQQLALEKGAVQRTRPENTGNTATCHRPLLPRAHHPHPSAPGLAAPTDPPISTGHRHLRHGTPWVYSLSRCSNYSINRRADGEVGHRQPAEGRHRHGAATRQALVDAAIETLKSEGFAGASARAIASRAGCNQAPGLLPFRLGRRPAAGRPRRGERATPDALPAPPSGEVTTPTELATVAADVFREDMDTGDVAVLVEMIAGASSTPGLGAQVAERIAPWRDFADAGHRGRPVRLTVGVGRPARRALPRRGGPVPRAGDAQSSRRRPRRPPPCSIGPGNWLLLDALTSSPEARKRRHQTGGRTDDASPPTTTMNATTDSGRPARRPTRDWTSSPAPSATRAGPSPPSWSGRAAGCGPSPATRPRAGQDGTSTSIPLDFDDLPGMVASMRGATTLYNTYWVRFAHGTRPPAGGREFEGPVLRRPPGRHPTGGPREHHPSVRRLALSLFPRQGPRRTGPGRNRFPMPFFARPSCSAATACSSTTSPGSSAIYPSSPSEAGATTASAIHVRDLAELAVAAGRHRDDSIVDAVGPERPTFLELVRSIRDAVGSRSPIIRVPGAVVTGAAACLNLALRDVLLTADEYRAMADNLADTSGPATGHTALSAWLAAHGAASAGAMPTSSTATSAPRVPCQLCPRCSGRLDTLTTAAMARTWPSATMASISSQRPRGSGSPRSRARSVSCPTRPKVQWSGLACSGSAS